MTDYKDTVFLPRSDFPMRGGLPTKEPELLARWQAMDLHGRIRKASAGREKFVLHDGPPYANGNIHIGHALDKILKDVVVRGQQMLGHDAPYVPGWDCHGLPIEWKIEEQYRQKGKDKDQVPILDFRAECRAFAQKWVDVQSEEFQRLGVVGDWANPYLTMTYPAEAQIVREIHKFLLSGALYQGVRPVLWSVVEKTALADAEVEYYDHVSDTIWVRFPVVKASHPGLADADIVIWTTTPWTMPGNRAIAYGDDLEYGVYQVVDPREASVERGAKLVIATSLADTVQTHAGIGAWTQVATLKGSELAGTVAAHPFRGLAEANGYYAFDVPLLSAEYVTEDAGTGFVHTAPGHGEDDFMLGQRHGLEVPRTLDDEGRFYPTVELFAGKIVYNQKGKKGDANPAAIDYLRQAGKLLANGKLEHSYPHSWRSKSPLIFRTTPQWFISMETTRLREQALAAIAETRWVPPQSRNRIESMVASRPDWCISRQRAWGVPLGFFVRRSDGKPLADPAVLDRIATIFEKEGADSWYARPASDFLGPDYDPADYEPVRDIVDVWFESGSTHAFVLEARPNLQWPADLYLEGSDQHRGWFQSSLLEAVGTRSTSNHAAAPFKAVLTHGFALDEQGRKMSKSLGNTTAPQDVVERSGADILRLWVLASDTEDDLRIGPEILKAQADTYRRLRNTWRYLLGGLDGFTEAERLPVDQMPELERWVLHRLVEIDEIVRKAYGSFEFRGLLAALHNFCAVDLSAFYFDVRKDCLYCDRPDSLRRRANRTVMDIVFDRLTAWLAPILAFTAEEAWLAREPGRTGSVHLTQFPEVPAEWRDDGLAGKWERVREIRRVVTGALEIARANKLIGASEQANPTVYLHDPADRALLNNVDFAEVSKTSDIVLSADVPPADAFTLSDVAGVGVVVNLASGDKCGRCWRVLDEVGSHHSHPELCDRCFDAITVVPKAAE
jgi:isoleucyl-tRNA synthetase